MSFAEGHSGTLAGAPRKTSTPDDVEVYIHRVYPTKCRYFNEQASAKGLTPASQRAIWLWHPCGDGYFRTRGRRWWLGAIAAALVAGMAALSCC